MNSNELYHYGVLGMKWGVRRYQNPDGSLTDLGRKRLYKDTKKAFKKASSSGEAIDSFKNNIAAHNVVDKNEYAKAIASLNDFRKLANESIELEEKYDDACLKTAKTLYSKYKEENPDLDWNNEKFSDNIFEYFHYNEAADIVDKTPIGKQYRKADSQSQKIFKEYEDSCRHIIDSIVGEYGDRNLTLVPGAVESQYKIVAEYAVKKIVEEGFYDYLKRPK